MESSSLNYFFVDILVNEFSEAKFILTIRDCYSWLESLISQHLSTRVLSERYWFRHYWGDVNDLRFRTNKKHAKEEKVLADNGLYTLDGYFSYWREHNSKVLATVSEERLLVVKTQEINQSLRKMEEFLGITPGTLPDNVHCTFS
jgi:hypothetical protein